MKLLILGGTGFIGSSLKNYFISKSKMKILCPTRKELNLTDFEDCKNYLKENSPDIILHAAVELKSVENSVRMLFNFLDNSDKFGKLIYLGSGAEYNPKKYTKLMKEKKSVQSYPESGYYLSKYICGREIEAHKKKEIYNLRLFGVYGETEEFKRRFISNNICRVLSGLPISMNREMKFDFLYTIDLCKIIENFCFYKNPKFKTYNLCSGNPVRFSELAKVIKKTMNVKEDIIIKNDGENQEYSGNPERLFKEIGNFKFTKHETAIKKMCKFFEKKFVETDSYIIKDD